MALCQYPPHVFLIKELKSNILYIMAAPKNLDELVEKLKTIKEMGYIQTHRSHDTGIGKTLEDLLDIPENNWRLPDVGEIELKAKRLESGSMLTLATKSPMPKGANKALFESYKYIDVEGHYNLHSTVCGSRENPQGLKAMVLKDSINIYNPNSIEAYWPITVFDDLVSKSNSILLVFALTKGERKTVNECFHFTEAYLLSALNKDKFAKALSNDKLKIDFRMGVYKSGKLKGRFHDHGTGFRINKRDFLELFDSYEQLI